MQIQLIVPVGGEEDRQQVRDFLESLRKATEKAIADLAEVVKEAELWLEELPRWDNEGGAIDERL